MSTSEAIPLGTAVGIRLRELRAEKQWLARQEDVARRMREEVGFGSWTRATVAAIETGKRDVSIEELIGLSYACAIPLREWFPGDGRGDPVPAGSHHVPRASAHARLR
jgi:transcriptional regulator with XRE-family HTH domain